MASYWEEMQKMAQAKRLKQPIDTSPSVMDPDAPQREQFANALEVADIASNLLPGKAALAGLGGMLKYKKAAGWADDAAAEALHMIGQKRPKGQIWTDTNTYLSPDGFLRQEIPDAGALVRQKNLASIVQQSPDKRPFISAKMGEGLDHPELYNEYPELAHMELLVKPRPPGSSTSAQFLGNKNQVVVYPSRDSDIATGNISRDDILHELQHKIQKVEDFPQKGGNVSNYRNLIEAAERAKGMKIKSDYKFDPTTGLMLKDIKQELAVRGDDSYKAYRDLLGEAESRMVEARSRMNEASRRGIRPMSTMLMDVPSVTVKDPYTGKWRRAMVE